MHVPRCRAIATVAVPTHHRTHALTYTHTYAYTHKNSNAHTHACTHTVSNDTCTHACTHGTAIPNPYIVSHVQGTNASAHRSTDSGAYQHTHQPPHVHTHGAADVDTNSCPNTEPKRHTHAPAIGCTHGYSHDIAKRSTESYTDVTAHHGAYTHSNARVGVVGWSSQRCAERSFNNGTCALELG